MVDADEIGDVAGVTHEILERGRMLGSPSQFMKPWMDTPMTPPVAATARIVSSSLLRTRSLMALGLAWVRKTGLRDSRAASSAVGSPQCERSMAMPTSFISRMSARPNRVRPPLRSSRQPSPAALPSL